MCYVIFVALSVQVNRGNAVCVLGKEIPNRASVHNLLVAESALCLEQMCLSLSVKCLEELPPVSKIWNKLVVVWLLRAVKASETHTSSQNARRRKPNGHNIEMQWRLVHRVWDSPDVLGRLRRRLQRARHFTTVRYGFDYLSDDSDLSPRATNSEMRAISTETMSEGDREEEAVSILDMMNEQLRLVIPPRRESPPSSPRLRTPSRSASP